MNTSNNTFVSVPGSDKPAIVLTPQFSGQLAVVDLGVIQRLAGWLPKVDFATVRQELAENITGSRDLHNMLLVIERELAFHKSVNLITTYDGSNQPDYIEKVGEVDYREEDQPGYGKKHANH